jgi:hypothetical protein
MIIDAPSATVKSGLTQAPHATGASRLGATDIAPQDPNQCVNQHPDASFRGRQTMMLAFATNGKRSSGELRRIATGSPASAHHPDLAESRAGTAPCNDARLPMQSRFGAPRPRPRCQGPKVRLLRSECRHRSSPVRGGPNRQSNRRAMLFRAIRALVVTKVSSGGEVICAPYLLDLERARTLPIWLSADVRDDSFRTGARAIAPYLSYPAEGLWAHRRLSCSGRRGCRRSVPGGQAPQPFRRITVVPFITYTCSAEGGRKSHGRRSA